MKLPLEELLWIFQIGIISDNENAAIWLTATTRLGQKFSARRVEIGPSSSLHNHWIKLTEVCVNAICRILSWENLCPWAEENQCCSMENIGGSQPSKLLKGKNPRAKKCASETDSRRVRTAGHNSLVWLQCTFAIWQSSKKNWGSSTFRNMTLWSSLLMLYFSNVKTQICSFAIFFKGNTDKWNRA